MCYPVKNQQIITTLRNDVKRLRANLAAAEERCEALETGIRTYLDVRARSCDSRVKSEALANLAALAAAGE